jgi:hypothetical protein
MTTVRTGTGRCAIREPGSIIQKRTGKHQIERSIRDFGLLKYLKKARGSIILFSFEPRRITVFNAFLF